MFLSSARRRDCRRLKAPASGAHGLFILPEAVLCNILGEMLAPIDAIYASASCRMLYAVVTGMALWKARCEQRWPQLVPSAADTGASARRWWWRLFAAQGGWNAAPKLQPLFINEEAAAARISRRRQHSAGLKAICSVDACGEQLALLLDVPSSQGGSESVVQLRSCAVGGGGGGCSGAPLLVEQEWTTSPRLDAEPCTDVCLLGNKGFGERCAALALSPSQLTCCLRDGSVAFGGRLCDEGGKLQISRADDPNDYVNVDDLCHISRGGSSGRIFVCSKGAPASKVCLIDATCSELQVVTTMTMPLRRSSELGTQSGTTVRPRSRLFACAMYESEHVVAAVESWQPSTCVVLFDTRTSTPALTFNTHHRDLTRLAAHCEYNVAAAHAYSASVEAWDVRCVGRGSAAARWPCARYSDFASDAHRLATHDHQHVRLWTADQAPGAKRPIVQHGLKDAYGTGDGAYLASAPRSMVVAASFCLAVADPGLALLMTV